MVTVKVEKSVMEYLVDGTGPGLVLVHGTGGSAEANWGHLVGRFSKHWTVIRPNYSGSGNTTDAGGSLSVEQLALTPDYLLIDGRDMIDWPCPQQPVIGGDGLSLSIAAASVLAKVYRDRMLVELDKQFPGYGLARHKGYCCPEHFEALARLGPTPLHRKSFSPVAQKILEFPEF